MLSQKIVKQEAKFVVEEEKGVMRMAIKYLGNQRIVHIRKDGTRQNSMDGLKVPKEISDLVMECVCRRAREIERQKSESEKNPECSQHPEFGKLETILCLYYKA